MRYPVALLLAFAAWTIPSFTQAQPKEKYKPIEIKKEATGGRPRDLIRARKARKVPLLDLCSLSSQFAEANSPGKTPPSAHAGEDVR